MNYIAWAVVALVTYSLVPPLSKVAADEVPIMVVALASNATITVANLGVVLYLTDDSLSSLATPHVVYVLGAGVFLSVGFLSYLHALSKGPVSVVTPIFGMFLVGSAAVGVVALGESVSARKVAGLGFAVVAVYLTQAG